MYATLRRKRVDYFYGEIKAKSVKATNKLLSLVIS